MAEMLDDVRNQKLAKLFKILDIDGDGAVSVADYEALGARLATVSGQRDSGKVAEMQETLKQIWEEFQLNVAGAEGGQVTESQFVHSLVAPQASDPVRFSQFIGLTCNLLFGVADTDGDDRISRAEHMLLGKEAFGLSDMETAESFDKLDYWNRGYATMDQYVIAYTEFLTSTEPKANGNSLLGNY